jgi:hypothetical protein
MVPVRFLELGPILAIVKDISLGKPSLSIAGITYDMTRRGEAMEPLIESGQFVGFPQLP